MRLFAIVLCALMTNVCRAEVLVSDTVESNLRTAFSFNGSSSVFSQPGELITSSATGQVSVDTDLNEVTHSDYSFTFPPVAGTTNWLVPNGFSSAIDVEFSYVMNLSPISLVSGPITLPILAFHPTSVLTASLAPADFALPPSISGTWDLSVDGVVQSGAFSIPLTLVPVTQNAIGAATIVDSSGQSTFVNLLFTQPPTPILSTTIANHDLEISSGGIILAETKVTRTATVPEPSSFLFLSLVAPALWLKRWIG